MKERFTAHAAGTGTGKGRRPFGAEGRGERSLRKDVIPLNTRAIRHKALKEYHSAERSLDRLKGQLKRYHDEDLPGFRSWLHQTFGHLLTRQRELAQTIEQKRTLLVEIEDLADRYGLSDVDAYRKFRWRQDHPAEAEQEDRQFEESQRTRAAPDMEDEREDADPWADEADEDDEFEEAAFGSVPDEDWDAFSDFVEMMTGMRPPPRQGRHGRPGPHPEAKSARALYRTIVRRLHPDHHGQMNEARTNLWHEAQQAYRVRDVNALYSILARCDAGQGGIGEHTPVSVIRRLTVQFRKTTHSVGREIRRMKTDLAWDFENKIRDPRFVRRMRLDLEDAIREAAWHLDSMTGTLSRLDRAAARPARPRKPCKTTRPAHHPDMEFDLPF